MFFVIDGSKNNNKLETRGREASVVLNRGLFEPLRFDGGISGVRRKLFQISKHCVEV